MKTKPLSQARKSKFIFNKCGSFISNSKSDPTTTGTTTHTTVTFLCRVD